MPSWTRPSSLSNFSIHIPVLALIVAAFSPPVHADSFAERFEQIKKTASADQLYRLLQQVPKGGDLHQHLNHSYLAEDWLRVAVDPKVTRGNAFYTRLRPRDCPPEPLLSPSLSPSSPSPISSLGSPSSDPRREPVRFHTVQRATYEQLLPCRKEEYVPLAALSESEQAEWMSALRIDRPGEGQSEFFEQIGPRHGELARDPNLARALLIENLRRFGREGLRYVEIQGTGPRFHTARGEPMDVEQSVQVLRSALADAAAQGIRVTARFIAIVVRTHPDAEARLEQAIALVARHRDLWVGVGYAGREQDDRGPALRFLPLFRRMRERYGDIPLSLHAGESTSSGSEVRDSLLLGARRIGHAVNLLGDPSTLLLLRGGRFLIEVNLISNLLLAYVPSIRQHPFPEFLRLGIPVCLNTDDRGAWDSNMTDEYFTAVTAFDLRWDEIVKIGRDSLEHSFADAALKAKLIADYQREITRFERRLHKDTWADELRRVSPAISGYAKRTFGL